MLFVNSSARLFAVQKVAGLLLSVCAIFGPPLGLSVVIPQHIAQAAKPKPKPAPQATKFFRYIMPDGSAKTGYKDANGVHLDCHKNPIVGWEKVYSTERTCN